MLFGVSTEQFLTMETYFLTYLVLILCVRTGEERFTAGGITLA